MSEQWENEGGNVKDFNLLIDKWWDNTRLNTKYTLREYLCKEMDWTDKEYEKIVPDKDRL